MARKNLPGYLKHKATGQALCVIDGRFFYLGKYGSKASREEYERIIAEYLNNGKRLPPTRTRNEITVEELTVRFLEWAEGYYIKDGKQTKSAGRIQTALSPVIRWYGQSPVSDFGPLALKFVREKMIEEGYTVKRMVEGREIEQREDFTRQTTNTRITIIKQAFKWGVENELVPPDVYQGLQAVAGLKEGRTKAPDKPPIPPVPVEVVEATIPFMPPMIADMVRVQLNSAMRPGEVRLLRNVDIDRSNDVWAYRPHSHKTQHHRKSRVVPLGPKAQEVLKTYLERKASEPEAYLFSPADSVADRLAAMRAKRKTKVQPSQRYRKKTNPKKKPGNCWRRDSYTFAISKACERAGVPHWCPLQLRHNAATETTSRFSLEAAKEFLGHSSIKTTEKYYVAPLPELAAKVAREIG